MYYQKLPTKTLSWAYLTASHFASQHRQRVAPFRLLILPTYYSTHTQMHASSPARDNNLLPPLSPTYLNCDRASPTILALFNQPVYLTCTTLTRCFFFVDPCPLWTVHPHSCLFSWISTHASICVVNTFTLILCTKSSPSLRLLFISWIYFAPFLLCLRAPTRSLRLTSPRASASLFFCGIYDIPALHHTHSHFRCVSSRFLYLATLFIAHLRSLVFHLTITITDLLTDFFISLSLAYTPRNCSLWTSV